MGQAAQLDCITCLHRQRSEWRGLSRAAVELLNETKVVNRYQAGQTIFNQGNLPLGLYCVESGVILLRKSDAEGRSIIVRMVNPGQPLGYRAFFSDQRYRASAEASTDAIVCWIDRVSVKKLMEYSPELVMGFLRYIANDLAMAETLALRSATLTVRTRLAHLLLSLKDRDGEVDETGHIILDMKVSRQDLASLLGTTPETIARVTKLLTLEKVAIFERRRVIIPDLDRLLDEVEPLD